METWESRISPAASAAFAAVFSYYCLDGRPGLIRGMVPALIVLISVLRVLGGSALPAGRYRSRFRKLNLLVLALGAGFSFGAAARLSASREIRFGIPRETVTGLSGILRDDPRSFNNGRGMGRLSLRAAAGPGGLRSSAAGEVSVFFPEGAVPRLKTFGRAAAVYVEGSFAESPSAGSGALFRAGPVHVITPPPALEQFRTQLRMGLFERFTKPDRYGRPRPWGGLAVALLLGIRDGLDREIAEAYKNAGCSHVLALSGMHLAVVSSAIAFLLKKPLGKRFAAAAGTIFILGYVFLAGELPSLERAAIMYFLGVLALWGNWPRRPLLLLGMAFMIQIALRPASGESLSFILSYLALGGILLLNDPLDELFRGRIPKVLAGPLSASLGAFTATLPAAALFFGVLRPVGIAAGLVIVPLITLFMTGSMIWLGLDIFAPAAAYPVGKILSILYDLLNRLVALAGRAPEIGGAPPAAVLGISLALTAAALFFRRRAETGKCLAPFA
jgi:competence protein ComEC